MGKKKYFLHLTFGILIGMFIVMPFLEWLGVPSFANVLVYLFGEADGANRFGAALFMVFIILLIVLVPIKK